MMPKYTNSFQQINSFSVREIFVTYTIHTPCTSSAPIRSWPSMLATDLGGEGEGEAMKRDGGGR